MSIENQLSSRRRTSTAIRRFVQAGLLCGIVDLLWAYVLTRVYGTSFLGLLQYVSDTAFGPGLLESDDATALLGLTTHFGVALAWSAVFLGLVLGSSRIRQVLLSRTGMIAVAAVYGPLIWIIMSTVVVPLRSGEPPTIGVRWWIQLAGHAVFVGLPIVWAIRGSDPRALAPGVPTRPSIAE